MPRATALALSLAALGGLAVAVVVDRLGPAPVASVARGSEEAFATGGLDERELPPGHGPIRWMGARAAFAFGDLPAGPTAVEVRVRGNAAAVGVVVNGRTCGALTPAAPRARCELGEGPPDGKLEVVLHARTVERGGRQLGALIGQIRVETATGWRVPPALATRLAALGGLAAAAALVARLPAWGAGLVGLLAAALAGGALWPQGLRHSHYAGVLPWLVAGSCALAALLVRALVARRRLAAGATASCFAALAAAFLLHGVASTSPIMVVSDANFHAHVLRDVARGDWFPTSVTQHARPFRIPYGPAFYALLVPGFLAGFDPLALVRWGAGIGGCLAAVALLWLLLPLGAARAASSLGLWLALPGSFDAYSAGNLSNAFGQSASVAFLAWWGGGGPLGPGLGAGLAAVAGISHLSSFLVLLVVAMGLVLARRRRHERRLLWGLALGLGLAALYYARHAGLVLEQAPRVLEGGGQGRGAAVGFTGAVLQQALTALREWGAPALCLALFARWRGPFSGIERDVRAYALGAAALLLPALVSPVEVRYVLALGPAVACLAAEGALRLAARGWRGALLAMALAGLQCWLAAGNLAQALLERYR